MAAAGKRVPSCDDPRFGEKGFYLDEFRGQTLAVALPGATVARQGDAAALIEAAIDLIGNGTRLLIVTSAPDGPRSAHARALARIATILPRPTPSARGSAVRNIEMAGGTRSHISVTLLRRVWKRLREHRLAIVSVASGRTVLADLAQQVTVRMGIRKLVVVDQGGGITNEGRLASFMDGSMLEGLLGNGQARLMGIDSRRSVLEAVCAALRGGVDSVNVCDLLGVGRELFTYEGAGTLFTLRDYCRVERLRVDDFLEVERLLERGQREGYLRRRTPKELEELLLSGYGATIGSGHLAGVCGLATEPYRGVSAGEIVGLYTITRFKGEGVGGKLLARVVDDARQLGLRYVFACTTHARARAFFARHGFETVRGADVPGRKWRGYVAARRRDITVHKLPITAE
jgi:N-acetylglutamate synthase-like GNAT family acetyltransferase